MRVSPTWIKSLSPGQGITAPVPNATAQAVTRSLFISVLHKVVSWVKLEPSEISGVCNGITIKLNSSSTFPGFPC